MLKHISEIKEEIEGIFDEITRQASEHINKKDVILTYSQSDLLVSFLEAAYHGVTDDDTAVMQSFGVEEKKGKQFEVIVAESAPIFSGH